MSSAYSIVLSKFTAQKRRRTQVHGYFELSQPGIILKNEEGFYFFIEYASDVQYSPEDAAEYLEMAADLDEIQVLFEDATK